MKAQHLLEGMHSTISITFARKLHVIYFPFQRGDRLYTPDSDVCRRQILTSKDAERITKFKMAADL